MEAVLSSYGPEDFRRIDACGDHIHAIPGNGQSKMRYCMQLNVILLSIRSSIFFSQKAPLQGQEGLLPIPNFQ